MIPAGWQSEIVLEGASNPAATHLQGLARPVNNITLNLAVPRTGLSDRDSSHRFMSDAYQFGDLLFDALTTTGSGSRFHRLLVV
jgi:hypothetical protein